MMNLKPLGGVLVSAVAGLAAVACSVDASDPNAPGGPNDSTPGADASSAETSVDAGTERGAGALDLNDVSFLFPLPSWEARDDLMAANTSGPRGELFPRAMYDAIAAKTQPLAPTSLGGPSELYPTLRAVSARIDPCFPADARAVPGCRKQIRLVLQPVIRDPADASLTTFDATVHLFYDLDEADWAALVEDVFRLKTLAASGTTGKPLGIHPTMKTEGLRGAYATALKSTLAKYAGSATLSRVALMQLAKHDSWAFIAFDRSGLTGNSFTSAPIPRTGESDVQLLEINFTTSTRGAAPHSSDPSPFPSGIDLGALGLSAGTVVSDDQVRAALKQAVELENPTSALNPQTADCATCHFVTRDRSFAEQSRGISTLGWPERFADARFDLARVDDVGDTSNVLRSFGYFGTKSALSQRTINETAAVAAAMSR